MYPFCTPLLMLSVLVQKVLLDYNVLEMEKQLQNIKSYNLHKWIVLAGFCLMYASVYLARFNINNLIPEISNELNLSELAQDVLYASIFLSYAAGSFVNGYIADKSNKKICILFGIIGSLTLNITSYMAESWTAFLIINLLNGFAQSIIWVSGLSMAAHWWPYNKRGVSIGLINMFSNISYLIMIFVPEYIFSGTGDNWHERLVYPMAPIFILTAMFVMMFSEKPESSGIPPYDHMDPITVEKDALLRETVTPTFPSAIKYFLSDGRTLIWCLIALISSLCRYGLQFWLPAYYSDNTGMFDLSSNLTNILLSLGMGVGTLVGCIIAGKYFHKNLGLMVTALAASCAAVVITFPSLSSKITVMCAIFLCGALLFAINGLLWMYSVNKGSRVYAGTVSGIINASAYLGAFIQIFLFRYIGKVSGSSMSSFVSIEILCILMVILGLVISNKDRIRREV